VQEKFKDIQGVIIRSCKLKETIQCPNERQTENNDPEN